MTREERTDGACERCLRRSWLLGELSRVLDYNCRADGRLVELLALEDDELVQALGGRKREELLRRHADFRASELARVEGVAPLCRHDRRYPRGLVGAEAPRMLHVAGGIERLGELSTKPVVAILGSRPATDYGIEIAGSLARGLAASGVSVVSDLDDSIASAVHAAVLEAGGVPLVVLGNGLGAPVATRRRSLLEQLTRTGCAVSELPYGARTRVWGSAAAKRTLAALGTVAIAVEADDDPRALRGARAAQAFEKPLGAVPGRVTSPVSRGTHALLREGAQLIRDVSDVLELLYEAEGRSAVRPPLTVRLADLEPRLLRTLEQVGAGRDTVEKLTASDASVSEVMRALGELESSGHLTRGDGGRYVLRDPLPRRAVR
jgi:DNA processing protein